MRTFFYLLFTMSIALVRLGAAEVSGSVNSNAGQVLIAQDTDDDGTTSDDDGTTTDDDGTSDDDGTTTDDDGTLDPN